jgi:hypothetical protein
MIWLATEVTNKEQQGKAQWFVEENFFGGRVFAVSIMPVDIVVAALREAWAWMPHGDGKTPAQRGALCETQNEALRLVRDTFRTLEAAGLGVQQKS